MKNGTKKNIAVIGATGYTGQELLHGLVLFCVRTHHVPEVFHCEDRGDGTGRQEYALGLHVHARHALGREARQRIGLQEGR